MDKNLRRLTVYYLYLFSAWSLFRYFVRLPEVVEELWFKPVIWLVPLFWWWLAAGAKWKLFEGRWWKSILMGVSVGGLVFLTVRFLMNRWNVPDLTGMAMGFTIATVEQLTFAGIVLLIINEVCKKEVLTISATALLFALIHLPINFLVYRLDLFNLGAVLILNFFLAYIAFYVRLRTKNVLAAILTHFGFLLALV